VEFLTLVENTDKELRASNRFAGGELESAGHMFSRAKTTLANPGAGCAKQFFRVSISFIGANANLNVMTSINNLTSDKSGAKKQLYVLTLTGGGSGV